MQTTVTLTPSVRDAVEQGAPVVALESTLISHGLPWPANRDTALAIEQTVRDNGATPATIAVIDGELRVGLDTAAIERLANDSDVMKLSRADLAMAVARRATGGTTVAATMIAAHRAGIQVFATGGIGGVHRGVEHSWDISADLQELSRTPITVVSAGAKAILDIPRTLEVLETLGVPVLSYGQNRFPAFWSRDSGLDAPLRVDSVDELVSFLEAREQLGISGGVLIGNPVPDAQAIAREQMDEVILRAVGEAEREGIRAKAVTPWLLERINVLTEGRSLETNRALIINNASLAARFATGISARYHRGPRPGFIG